jgi:hypothetical protein
MRARRGGVYRVQSVLKGSKGQLFVVQALNDDTDIPGQSMIR